MKTYEEKEKAIKDKRKQEIHQKNVQILKDLKAGTLKQNFDKVYLSLM